MMGNLGLMEILLILISIGVWAGFLCGIRAYFMVKKLEREVNALKPGSAKEGPKS